MHPRTDLGKSYRYIPQAIRSRTNKGKARPLGKLMVDVDRLKEFIRKNLRATLGLKEISTAFGKDPGDLDRAFRNVEGMTIKRYVDIKLKEKLQQRLADGGVKGYEVAKEFEFLSEQSFYRWSKRVFGYSFSNLRKQMDKHC